MLVPLRLATIHSDFASRVEILPHDQQPRPDLHWSHGACQDYWIDASPERLILEMTECFVILTREASIPIARVHRAFCVIPEYRARLDPGHDDALSPQEWKSLSLMMDLPRNFYAHCA